jgi:hypothetical protein
MQSEGRRRAPFFFSQSDGLGRLSSVRFAPIATHEPVGAVTCDDEGKTSADKGSRHRTRFVTLTASNALTKSVPIPWVCERRNRKGTKYSRGDNQFFHLSLPHV